MPNQNNEFTKAFTVDFGAIEARAIFDEVNKIQNAIMQKQEKALLKALDDKSLMKLRDSIHDELATRGSFR